MIDRVQVYVEMIDALWQFCESQLFVPLFIIKWEKERKKERKKKGIERRGLHRFRSCDLAVISCTVLPTDLRERNQHLRHDCWNLESRFQTYLVFKCAHLKMCLIYILILSGSNFLRQCSPRKMTNPSSAFDSRRTKPKYADIRVRSLDNSYGTA